MADGIAIDLTKADGNARTELLKKEGWIDQIGYAEGVYGCNGKLLQGHKSNQLYAITSRTTAIYIF